MADGTFKISIKVNGVDELKEKVKQVEQKINEIHDLLDEIDDIELSVESNPEITTE